MIQYDTNPELRFVTGDEMSIFSTLLNHQASP